MTEQKREKGYLETLKINAPDLTRRGLGRRRYMYNAVTYLYSVFDAVAGFGGNAFEQPNDMVAVRNIKKNMENEPNKEDFKLFRIGQFDHVQMKLIPCDKTEVFWNNNNGKGETL